MIVSRYLAKEVYSTLLATASILLVIFFSNQVIRYLRDAAAGELAGHDVVLLLLLQLPHLLALLLPLSLFLAILLAYGRLYADNEMTVLFCSGMSPLKLLDVTVRFSFVIVVIVAFLSLWVDPRVSRYSEEILAGNTASILEVLVPNKFQPLNKSKWMVYVGKTSKDKRKLEGVFAAEQLNISSVDKLHAVGIVFAKSGYKMIDKTSNGAYLVLTDGYRYEGIPGKKDFKITKYSEYGIKLGQKYGSNVSSSGEDTRLTSWLWKNRHDSLAAAELMWRISLPINAFILALLGVALSKIKPKHGRYAKVVPAACCYIVYAQLIFLSRAWIKKGLVPLSLNMWWVHALMLVLVFLIFMRQSIWSNRISRVWSKWKF